MKEWFLHTFLLQKLLQIQRVTSCSRLKAYTHFANIFFQNTKKIYWPTFKYVFVQISWHADFSPPPGSPLNLS